MTKNTKIWLIAGGVLLGLFVIGFAAKRAFFGSHYGPHFAHHGHPGHHAYHQGYHGGPSHFMRGRPPWAMKAHGKWGKGGKFHKRGEEKSITGKVYRVNDYGPMYAIVVDTGSEKLYVGIAPSFYTTKENISFNEGDSVEISGRLISPPDTKPFMFAGEVKSGDKAYTLRNEDGFPVWAKGRKWGKRGGPWGMKGRDCPYDKDGDKDEANS